MQRVRVDARQAAVGADPDVAEAVLQDAVGVAVRQALEHADAAEAQRTTRRRGIGHRHASTEGRNPQAPCTVDGHVGDEAARRRLVAGAGRHPVHAAGAGVVAVQPVVRPDPQVAAGVQRQDIDPAIGEPVRRDGAIGREDIAWTETVAPDPVAAGEPQPLTVAHEVLHPSVAGAARLSHQPGVRGVRVAAEEAGVAAKEDAPVRSRRELADRGVGKAHGARARMGDAAGLRVDQIYAVAHVADPHASALSPEDGHGHAVGQGRGRRLAAQQGQEGVVARIIAGERTVGGDEDQSARSAVQGADVLVAIEQAAVAEADAVGFQAAGVHGHQAVIVGAEPDFAGCELEQRPNPHARSRRPVLQGRRHGRRAVRGGIHDVGSATLRPDPQPPVRSDHQGPDGRDCGRGQADWCDSGRARVAPEQTLLRPDPQGTVGAHGQRGDAAGQGVLKLRVVGIAGDVADDAGAAIKFVQARLGADPEAAARHVGQGVHADVAKARLRRIGGKPVRMRIILRQAA